MNNTLSGLFSAKKVALFSHIHPDGDTIGAQLALAEGLQQHNVEVICYNFMLPPENFNFLKNIDWIKLPNQEDFLANIDTICFVDCGELSRTGLSMPHLEGKIIYNIDHHKSNTHYGNYNWVKEEASSTCEIVYEILKNFSCQFTPSLSTSLYLGISTDTGSFKYANTNSNTHLIASDLISQGADTTSIRLNIYENISINRYRLLGYIYQSTQFAFNNKIAYLSISKKLENSLNLKDEDYSGISSTLKEISGVEVAVLIRYLDKDKTKISMRSKSYLDVSTIAEIFGGGGHARAAGAVINKSLSQVEQEILEQLEKNLVK